MAGLGDAAVELESIARHLRRAGDTELIRKLNAGMRDGVRHVPDQIREQMKPHMPDPYAAALAEDVRIGISVRTTGADPGVSVTAKATGKGRKLRRLDAGLLTHPLFGDREHWYTQPGKTPGGMRPGWFTGPCEDAAPEVRIELEKALHEVAAEAVSKGAL